MIEKTKKQFIEEIDVLHSGLMAIEELLISKGVVTLDELNSSIRKTKKECNEARKSGKNIHSAK